MNDFLTGFTTTLGGVTGVLCAFGALFLVVKAIKTIIKKSRNKKKLPKLILKYRNQLIKLEQFDEIIEIDKFLERLKKNELPKELAGRYSAKYIKTFLKEHNYE